LAGEEVNRERKPEGETGLHGPYVEILSGKAGIFDWASWSDALRKTTGDMRGV
jgi:hypothetical protein